MYTSQWEGGGSADCSCVCYVKLYFLFIRARLEFLMGEVVVIKKMV